MSKVEEKVDLIEKLREEEKVEEVEEVTSSFLLVFRKPYTFEGKEYREVDLSCMENLTVQDMSRIEKRRAMANGYQPFSLNPEYSVDYACYFAAEASKLPVEFFLGLPASEGIALRRMVSSFLL